MRRQLKLFLLSVLIIAFFDLFFTNFAKAQNGSLYLSPSSGKVSVGETVSIILRVNTGGVAINAAEGSIVFDQQKLAVTSISKSGSIFSIWASEPKFSNAEGTIEFAGGIPNPGFSGSNGLLLTITFRAKAATNQDGADAVLVSGAILANDGAGTDILASLGKANFLISPSSAIQAIPTPVEKSLDADNLINIKSSTHPNQEKWYSNNDPLFNWELSDGVEAVSYLVTDKPESNPGTVPDGWVSEAKFTDLVDGVNYFHLRFRRTGIWGSISHFKFQIDSKPPQEFNVLVTDDNSNEPKLVFESSDDLSGIDHYEIKIDKKEWIVLDKSLAGKPYSLINQGHGEHQVIVRAVDGAGNLITTSVMITMPGSIWKKFVDMIWWIFHNGILPAILVALVALSHEFFEHSKLWRKLKKNLKFKKTKNRSNPLDLRDIT